MSSDNDAPPTISYTSKRTTTKTRTAATSARRRKNIPLCHASGSDNPDGKDQNSWFARKSVGWTDEEIKNHVVSGGVSNGGKSFSMVGDVILGAASSTSKKDKKKKKRRMKQFAWEEDDEEDIEDGGSVGRIMTAADIMDEKDEVDFMAPVSVSKSFQMKSSANADNNTQDDTTKSANKSKSRRRQNAALDELAQVCGGDTTGSNSRIQPTSANESIGWRLLRVLGYRSRLGMAFVPLAGHVGGLDSIDNEVKELGNGKHEAKWLASKRLRAIRLPSIQNVDGSKNSSDVTKEGKKKTKVLTIPPPKVNRHGIGFDPFKNAPEFRKFHERRQELAKKQGRSTEDDNARGSNRYSTDNLKDGRQALWDKRRSDVGKDIEDEMSDPGIVKSHHQSSSHYAADRDYTDFIGTKASSGFALHDEDDANVYQDGEGSGNNGDGGEYTTEIHSPVASEDEDDNNGLGLFGKPAILEKKSKASERGMKGVEDSGKVAADAWSAWGIGESPAVKRTTMDGKPPLSGFTLAASTDSQAKSVAPKRWKGPIVPSGYVLKHHVFTKEEDGDIKESVVDGNSGLGLDLQHRQEQQPSRASVPKVPPSRMQPPPPDGKMLSRGGNEMNFHAVKESMKNRFTSAAETTTATNASESEVKDDNNNKQDMDEEEWVTVEVSTWLPTRLLCKRWGVAAPSTVGVSETGKGGLVQSKEENYFRQTIMAEHPDVGSTNLKTPATSGGKVKPADDRVHLDNFLGDDDQEDIAPPPERPSDTVFQSIFNAESDMDISSDDDNTSDGVDLDTTRANDETDVKIKKESAASVDRSPLPQTNGSSNADIKPRSADQYNNDLLPAADSTDSDSSGSSRNRQKRRKKSDERKRHRRSESSDEEDRRRRKKKKHKHKRSKHKKGRH